MEDISKKNKAELIVLSGEYAKAATLFKSKRKTVNHRIAQLDLAERIAKGPSAKPPQKIG